MDLHVATVSSDTVWKDKKANLAAAERHVGEALTHAPQTRIILFPELSLTGFVLDDSVETLAEPVDGPSIHELQRIASANRVAIIAGLIEQGPERPFNTAVAVDWDGRLLARYRKCHSYTGSAEPTFYAAGDSLTVFELDGWKCGLSICFDIRFPRLFEAYRAAGVECLFSGFNWLAGRNKPKLIEHLVKARANENQWFMVAVDRSGADPNTAYTGVSVIANPYGEDIGTCRGPHTWAVLDKSDVEDLRATLPLTGAFKSGYRLD